MGMTAAEIRNLLGLDKHATCGFVTETYRSEGRIPGDALPAVYGAARPYGSALYFLVTPEAPVILHRIRADQIYHHYLGDPLDVLLLYPDGTGRVATVGSVLDAGMRPQLLIPGGTFHAARVQGAGSYALLGTCTWPGVEPPDVEMGDAARAQSAYPTLAREIAAFGRPATAV